MGASKSDKVKCYIVAVLCLIINLIFTCASIPILVLKIKKPIEHLDATIIMEDNTWYILVGTGLAFGLFGVMASVMLICGLKYKKPGYLVVFFCYIFLASILLILSGLLLLLKVRWRVAIAAFNIAVFGFISSSVIYRTYEGMVQYTSHIRRNTVTNVALLAESVDDLSEDNVFNYSNNTEPPLY